MGRMEINFGNTAPYTTGVEEEFQLVDPESLALTPGIEEVLAARDAAGLPEESVTSELSASCLETRSPILGTVAALAEDLPTLREKVGKLVESRGLRLLAAGTHPFSEATEQRITSYERYHKVEREMGWVARTQAIYGLHVHVAVPDAEYAIRATSALAGYVPLFVALSANSPFWRGADTRLASTRTKVFDLFPRSGLPPAFGSWADYEHHVGTLIEAGLIPDYTFCWWDARPHPGLGTVELRAMDAQTNPARSASLAALAQCIVATAEEHPPQNPLYTAENKWLAVRHGLRAKFCDFDTNTSTSAREMARGLVKSLSPVAQDLGCANELEGILEITEDDTGAEKQRSVFGKRSSVTDVAAYLVSETA
jgi:carboxylate-amine ligase